MENLGFISAFLAALFWGSYVVPFRKSGSRNTTQFQVLMTVGIFVFSLIASFVLRYPLNLNFYGIAGGLIWGLANAMSLVAVSNLGISRAMPIWVSMVILTSFAWGAFFFHELPKGIFLGMGGVFLIVLSIILIGSMGNATGKKVGKGILLAILTGVLFGSSLTPQRLGNLDTQTYFFPMASGILLFGIISSLIKRAKSEKKAVIGSLISGGIWGVGNLLAITSVSLIGLAKGLPLTQAAVLISVLWGVFFFKGITKRKEIVKVIVGAIVLISGIIILSLA